MILPRPKLHGYYHLSPRELIHIDSKPAQDSTEGAAASIDPRAIASPAKDRSSNAGASISSGVAQRVDQRLVPGNQHAALLRSQQRVGGADLPMSLALADELADRVLISTMAAILRLIDIHTDPFGTVVEEPDGRRWFRRSAGLDPR